MVGVPCADQIVWEVMDRFVAPRVLVVGVGRVLAGVVGIMFCRLRVAEV